MIFFSVNYFLKSYNSVYFLNGFSTPIEIMIDGNSAVKIHKTSSHEMKLSEGEHSVIAKVSGQPEKKSTFNIKGGLIKRFFKSL